MHLYKCMKNKKVLNPTRYIKGTSLLNVFLMIVDMRPLCEPSLRALSLNFFTNEERKRHFNAELNVVNANRIAEEVYDNQL